MKILLIDDHPLIQDAVRVAIEKGVPGTELLTFARLDQCLTQIQEGLTADLALLDLGLPGYQDIEALEEFRLQCASIPVVVLSGREDRSVVMECLDAGAMGYIPKSVGPSIMIGALRLVASGGIYIPPVVLQAEQPRPAEVQTQGGARNGTHRVSPLTERQETVLRLVVKGLPNKTIARELNLSENTIKAHVSAVLSAIGAQNRTQAVLAASRLGIRV